MPPSNNGSEQPSSADKALWYWMSWQTKAFGPSEGSLTLLKVEIEKRRLE